MFGRINEWFNDTNRVVILTMAVAMIEDNGTTPTVGMLDHLYAEVSNVDGLDYLDADQLDADLESAEAKGLLVTVWTDAGVIVVTTALADRVCAVWNRLTGLVK